MSPEQHATEPWVGSRLHPEGGHVVSCRVINTDIECLEVQAYKNYSIVLSASGEVPPALTGLESAAFERSNDVQWIQFSRLFKIPEGHGITEISDKQPLKEQLFDARNTIIRQMLSSKSIQPRS